MSGRLVIHAWVDIADPWSYIGIDRLLGGIALAQAEEARPIDVDVHAYLGPGRAWEADDARKIAAVAGREGLRIDPQTLARRVPAGRRRGLHRLVYAAKAAGTDLADGAKRGVEAFMEIQAAVFSGDADLLAQVEARAERAAADSGQTGSRQAGTEESGSGQAGNVARDHAGEDDSKNANSAGPENLGSVSPKNVSEAEGQHAGQTGRRESLDEQIDRDIDDAKRMRIAGLPLVVIGGVVSVVGAQGRETYAELIAEAGGVVERIDRAPKDRHLRLG